MKNGEQIQSTHNRNCKGEKQIVESWRVWMFSPRGCTRNRAEHMKGITYLKIHFSRTKSAFHFKGGL